MTEINIETLTNLIKSNIMEVTFTKTNGEERKMTCTLMENYLPTYNEGSTRKKNDNVLSVWDLDKDGWRSFRKDTITEYKIKEDINVSEVPIGFEQN